MHQEPTIRADIERYIDAMWMEKGLSNNTLSSYRSDLTQFEDWLQKNYDSSLMQTTRSSLQAYLGGGASRRAVGQGSAGTALPTAVVTAAKRPNQSSTER